MSKKPGKRRWSLTLLYSTAFFLIQLAAVLITAALSFLLTKLGVLDNLGIPRNSGFAMLIVMLLISVLVGSVVAIGTVKIPLRPFNRLINNIDRLAAGDFTARMHYGKVMGDNPVFQELSESFNAMAEELENTQMLRSDFINNFSHEFKTPIVSIAGFDRRAEGGIPRHHRGRIPPAGGNGHQCDEPDKGGKSDDFNGFDHLQPVGTDSCLRASAGRKVEPQRA